ncbi:hypothetical protein DY000_02043848, partial [Brassica cretica]
MLPLSLLKTAQGHPMVREIFIAMNLFTELTLHCKKHSYGFLFFLVLLVLVNLVELKNGETYNGHLVNCDTWMNIHLREVICTSKDGDRFWRMPECYIRGNTIKYLRVPDEVYFFRIL